MAAAIKMGFMTRQFLYSSVLLFCFAYVFSPPSLVLNLVLLVAIWVSSALTFTYFAKYMIMEPVKFYMSKNKLEPTDVPEIREVAAKAGVRLPKKGFDLTYEDIPAMTNVYSKKMVLNRNLLADLTPDERRFVGGHEVTHIADRVRNFALLMALGLGAGVPTALSFSLLGLPPMLIPLPALAATMIATYSTMRNDELRADIGGARFAPEEAAKSALVKIYGVYGMDFASDTHPSGIVRMENLRKFYERERLRAKLTFFYHFIGVGEMG